MSESKRYHLPDVKSPFTTDSKVYICTEITTLEKEGVKVSCPQSFFHCEKTGKDFTTGLIDSINLSTFYLYFNQLDEI